MNCYRLAVHPFFMPSPTQACKHCGRAVKGRTDKQFCNDGCRNQYHNQRNSCQNNYMRQVNHLLQKNRRILAAIFVTASRSKTIAQEQLAEQGYQFGIAPTKPRQKKEQLDFATNMAIYPWRGMFC